MSATGSIKSDKQQKNIVYLIWEEKYFI